MKYTVTVDRGVTIAGKRFKHGQVVDTDNLGLEAGLPADLQPPPELTFKEKAKEEVALKGTPEEQAEAKIKVDARAAAETSRKAKVDEHLKVHGDSNKKQADADLAAALKAGFLEPVKEQPKAAKAAEKKEG